MCSAEKLLVCDLFLAFEMNLTEHFCNKQTLFMPWSAELPQATIPYSICIICRYVLMYTRIQLRIPNTDNRAILDIQLAVIIQLNNWLSKIWPRNWHEWSLCANYLAGLNVYLFKCVTEEEKICYIEYSDLIKKNH